MAEVQRETSNLDTALTAKIEKLDQRAKDSNTLEAHVSEEALQDLRRIPTFHGPVEKENYPIWPYTVTIWP